MFVINASARRFLQVPTSFFFLGRNKKNNVYPCKPHFYYIKVWFKGGGYIGMFFCDELKKASALFKFTTKHVVVYIILT